MVEIKWDNSLGVIKLIHFSDLVIQLCRADAERKIKRRDNVLSQ